MKHATLALAAVLAVAGWAMTSSPIVGIAHADACADHGDTVPEDLSVENARAAVICFINKERGKSLRANGKLNEAAQRHSGYMRRHHCFAHQCPGEKSPEKRLRAVNYITNGLSRWLYGENLVWGIREQATPRAIVNAWMHSPPHRANILNPAFNDVGIGFAHGSPNNPDAPGGLYTADFGFRRG